MAKPLSSVATVAAECHHLIEDGSKSIVDVKIENKDSRLDFEDKKGSFRYNKKLFST